MPQQKLARPTIVRTLPSTCESLSRTIKYAKIGKYVNIEKSLLHGQKISGHYVQGHVDSTAKIKGILIIDKSWVIKLKLENVAN